MATACACPLPGRGDRGRFQVRCISTRGGHRGAPPESGEIRKGESRASQEVERPSGSDSVPRAQSDCRRTVMGAGVPDRLQREPEHSRRARCRSHRRAIRHSSGGCRYCKAMGVVLPSGHRPGLHPTWSTSRDFRAPGRGEWSMTRPHATVFNVVGRRLWSRSPERPSFAADFYSQGWRISTFLSGPRKQAEEPGTEVPGGTPAGPPPAICSPAPRAPPGHSGSAPPLSGEDFPGPGPVPIPDAVPSVTQEFSPAVSLTLRGACKIAARLPPGRIRIGRGLSREWPDVSIARERRIVTRAHFPQAGDQDLHRGAPPPVRLCLPVPSETRLLVWRRS